MERPPWSSNQLKKLGVSIRDGLPLPQGAPTYDDVLLWYNELAIEVQSVISQHPWSGILGDRPVEVTSRAKTIDTLREKLQRDHSTPLASIQDLAGVRLEAEMSLDEQDLIAEEICALFQQAEGSVHDLRSHPHSGYRAVHVWLRIPWRVEVQIRTHMQGEWANMYESAADYFGRSIRYDELPQDEQRAILVAALQAVSVNQVAGIESLRNQAESLRVFNSNMLSGLDQFDLEDTLPSPIAEALDIRAEIEERLTRAQDEEREMRSTLAALKGMFDSMTGQGG